MHYADLTPIKYGPGDPEGLLAVGWLDDSHPFPKGVVPERVCDTLLAMAILDEAGRRKRGFHDPGPVLLPRESTEQFARVTATAWGRRYWLGSTEIKISHQNLAGRAFLCHDLIYFYITKHSYLPPSAFIISVLAIDTASLLRRMRKSAEFLSLDPA